MPMNLEFVFSTYGIWLVVLVIYVWVTRRRLKSYTNALENLEHEKKS